jgi:hypothetical protein
MGNDVRRLEGDRQTAGESSFHSEISASSSGTAKAVAETSIGPSTGPKPASSMPAIIAKADLSIRRFRRFAQMENER